MSHRRWWPRVPLVSLGALVLGIGSWLIARGEYHRLYDAAFIPVVAERITRGAVTPEATAARLAEFTYLNLRPPWEVPVMDTEPEHVILRGYAWCDQAVFVFLHLLREKGIASRLTWLRRADEVSPHTVAEVFLERKWRLFDVYYGLAPRRRDGRPATIVDLLLEPALFAPSRAPAEWYQHARISYVSDPAAPEFPSARANVEKALVRWVVTMAPTWMIDRLQDLYLRLPMRPIPDPRLVGRGADGQLFLRARHYHAFLRGRDAEAAYRELLTRYPTSPLAEHALYNLALLQLTQLAAPRATIETARMLRDRFPGTVWHDEIRYLEARAQEAAGNCSEAVRLYNEVSRSTANGMEDARTRLGRLRCSQERRTRGAPAVEAPEGAAQRPT